MLKFAVCLMSLATVFADDVTFNVTSLDGSVQQLKYTRRKSSECIYEQRLDVLTCMANHPYRDVTSEWKEDPDYIRYVSVNCLNQEDDRAHHGLCLCKTASSVPPSSGQDDKYYWCSLKLISMGIFNNTHNIEVLDLSDNQISVIGSRSFNGLPRLKYLSLSRNKFTMLPSGLFCDTPNLEYLALSGLSLDVFPSHSFKCKTLMDKLTIMDLSNSNLKDVPGDSLEYFPALRSLDLGGNSLVRIYKRSFNGGTSLRHLNLSHNALEYLFPHFCDYLPNMTNLYLHRNNFKTFSFEEVATCEATANLDLSMNQITSFYGNISALVLLKTMNISYNAIPSLNVSFQDLTNLETLDASHNQISKLNSDQFAGVLNLNYFDISHNALNYSDDFEALFTPLRNLHYLDMRYNKIKSIPNNSFNQLQNVTALLLSNNLLDTLWSNSFFGLSSLEQLMLDFNDLTTLPRGLFDSLTSLQHLSLSFNKLSLIQVVFWPPVRTLTLANNEISTLPLTVNFTSMETFNISYNKLSTLFQENLNQLLQIDLSFNKFSDIPFAVLQTCKNLITLNMEGNQVTTNVTDATFTKLSSMTALNLANNKIEGMNELFSETSLRQLLSLNMSNNPLRTVYQLSRNFSDANITNIDLSNCSLTQLEQNVFTGLMQLETVILSDNNMETFPPFLADDDTHYVLTGNPIVCACNMSWLILPYVEIDNIRISTLKFTVPKCKVYTENKLYDPQNLHRRQFMCPETKNCDAKCACFNTEQNGGIKTVICRQNLRSAPATVSVTALSIFLDGNNFNTNSSLAPFLSFSNMSTKELYLNSSSIRLIDYRTFHGFASLEILSLANNLIETLSVGILKNKTFLKQLYIGDNLLNFIEAGVFDGLPSLNELDISGNNLATLLPKTLLELSSLNSAKYYFLARNPWACNCTNLGFKDFIDEVVFKIRDRKALSCRDDTREIRYIPRSYFVCQTTSDSQRNPETIIGIIFGILIILMLLAAVVYFRRELLSLLYSNTGCHVPGKHHYPGMHFDGFISYDPSDQHCSAFVENDLMPKLKNNGYNFQTSADLIADIELTKQTIEDSKCSVFIVNKNFSSNTFFLNVFRSAVERNKADNRHTVVLIIHGDIDLQTLEPEVMKRLRKGDYITSRSRLWWQRLMYELPEPSGLLEVGDNDDVSESDVIVFSSLRAESQYDSI